MFVNECHLKYIKLLFCIIPYEYMCVRGSSVSVGVMWPSIDGPGIFSSVCAVCVHLPLCLILHTTVVSLWDWEDFTQHFYKNTHRPSWLSALWWEPWKSHQSICGVYQSPTDCGTDGIIWPRMLLLMISLFKMSASCCCCYFHCCPGNCGARSFTGAQLDFDKNLNVM